MRQQGPEAGIPGHHHPAAKGRSSAPVGNAVNDFGSRIRKNSDVCSRVSEVLRLQLQPKDAVFPHRNRSRRCGPGAAAVLDPQRMGLFEGASSAESVGRFRGVSA